MNTKRGSLMLGTRFRGEDLAALIISLIRSSFAYLAYFSLYSCSEEAAHKSIENFLFAITVRFGLEGMLKFIEHRIACLFCITKRSFHILARL